MSFRRIPHTQGSYSFKNETRQYTIEGDVTNIEEFIHRHNLLVCAVSGSDTLYVLSLLDSGLGTGIYPLKCPSIINKIYKIDDDNLLILSRDTPVGVMNLNAHRLPTPPKYVDVINGEERFYTSRIDSMPVIPLPTARGFKSMQYVKITDVLVSVGDSAASFNLVISSEGKELKNEMRAASADNLALTDTTSLPVTDDYLGAHALKRPQSE